MKKSLLIIALLMHIASNAQFFENFEKGVPGTMIQKAIEGETTFIDFSIASVGVDYPLIDKNSAVFFNGITSKAVTTSLETPILDLLTNDFELEFKYMQKPLTKDYGNELIIELSNDMSKSWIDIAKLITTDIDIKTIKIDLSDFKTSSKSIIRFKTTQFVAYKGYPIVIDNISVHKKQLSVVTKSINTEINVLIYPNPSHGIFTVAASDLIKITILDLNGRILKEVYNLDKENVIDLSSFSVGLYFVKTETKLKTEIQKIIVE